MHKAAKKANLDLNVYNQTKRQIAEIEYEIRRLRDPLYLHLPAIPPKTDNYSNTEIETSKKYQKLTAGLPETQTSSFNSLIEAARKRFKSKE